MDLEMQNDISTLLSESFLESSPVQKISLDSDPDISQILLESINKSKDEINPNLTQEEIAWVDSCLSFNENSNWDEIKDVLIDFENPNLDSDEEMEVEREREREREIQNPNLEAREGIFGIWEVDFEHDSDEEIELIKDLKNLMKIGNGEEDSNSNSKFENPNLDLNLGEEEEKIDGLVMELGNLSLNQMEGWNDKNL